MKSGIICFSAILLFTLFIHKGFSQQAVLPAGGEATGSAGTASCSVGQLSFMTLSGSQGVATEGVQQPYEILFNGIHDQGISLECKAWPNPATTCIWLTIENHEIKNLKCRLCTLTGVILKDIQVKDKTNRVPLEDIAAGTYLLTVSENDILLNSYKIIKK